MTTSDRQRIAKFMASAGLCSRRDAERWIEDGRVMVNGAVLLTPVTLVGAEDEVIVDGKYVQQPTGAPRLFLYHKPAGLVTSHRDEKNRATVFDYLPRTLPRVISIGRLDLDSEGLLLLTTSGALARAMELPDHAQKRVYRVRVRGTPEATHLEKLRRGVVVDGIAYQPIDAEPDRTKDGRNQWITLTLREGKNREIRRIFDAFDLPVSRLIRIQYGDFHLDDLAPKDVREVAANDVIACMKKVGLA